MALRHWSHDVSSGERQTGVLLQSQHAGPQPTIRSAYIPFFFFIFSNYTPKLIHQHFQVTHYTRRHQATRLLNDNCGCKEFQAFSFAVCAVVCVKRKLDLKCV